MRRQSKRSRPQNNEGHKSQFPPCSSCILRQKLRGGNPAHYLNWWFPAHIRAESIAQLSAYATHFICRCACARRKWRFVIVHTRPKSNKLTIERDKQMQTSARQNERVFIVWEHWSCTFGVLACAHSVSRVAWSRTLVGFRVDSIIRTSSEHLFIGAYYASFSTNR